MCAQISKRNIHTKLLLCLESSVSGMSENPPLTATKKSPGNEIASFDIGIMAHEFIIPVCIYPKLDHHGK